MTLAETNRPTGSLTRRQSARGLARRAIVASLVVLGGVLAGASPALAAAPTVVPGTVGKGPGTPQNSIRLSAFVDANGAATTYRFQHATNPAFTGAVSVPVSVDGDAGSADDSTIVVEDVSGLQPATTYYWRVTVQNADGSDTATAARSFDTYPNPPSGGCPNAQIRERQGAGYLSRCRAFELVSSGFKSYPVVNGQVSRSGDRALYATLGGNDDTGFGVTGLLLADRTADGWHVSNPLPPRSVFESGEARIVSASPELDAFTVYGTTPLSIPGEPNYMMRYVPDTGALTLGAHVSRDQAANAALVLGSEDQTHVTSRMPVPGETYTQVYDISGQTAEIVSRLPDGSMSTCGTGAVSFLQVTSSGTQNWVTPDGGHVFFISSDADCTRPKYLYVREAGVTHLIAGPPASGPDSAIEFVQATPDGSQVFYSTESGIAPSDVNGIRDLYRFTSGLGSVCLTCVAPAAAIDEGILVAEGGGRAYFTSTTVLAAGATAGERNLYVWRSSTPEQVTFVAPADSLGTGGQYQDAFTTFDGAVLVFTSRRAELDGLTGRSNGGFTQRYRYDDRSGALSCMSCPPERATTNAPQVNSYSGFYAVERPTGLTQDGRSFFFITGDSLVTEDVNRGNDVYEWRDGEVGLVTPGRDTPRGLDLFSVSADGRDVVFGTDARLTSGVRDGSTQLYDARVGGGFPPERLVPACGGDQCQGQLGSPPGRERPGSASGSAGQVSGGVRAVIGGVRRLSALDRTVLARGGSARLKVKVNRPGRVSVVGRANIGGRSTRVASASVTAGSAGSVSVRFALSARARARLKRTGSLAMALTVRFRDARPTVVSVTLKATTPKLRSGTSRKTR